METEKRTPIRDVYQIVTNQILEQLKKGIIPWKKTWTGAGLPQNLITGKPYRGLNVWLLASLGYSQNFFLSFKELEKIGGKVKEKEKPHIVVFYNWPEKEDESEKAQKKKPILRYYRVYNIAQCDGIPEAKIPIVRRENHPIDGCKHIVEEMPNLPLIVFVKEDPFYNLKDDFINMPSIEKFDSSESYYETLFHELIHSTMHESRCNRVDTMKNSKFGSQMYSQEELVAEFGACYLKSISGFKDSVGENSSAYIQNWYAVLEKNPKVIVYAGSQAQKAVDFILNLKS